jgi:hypothetical protein
MTTTTERYNGWRNYETWAVKLWLDNKESSYQHLASLTANVWASATATSWGSRSDTARVELAEAIKEWIEAETPQLGATLWADLLNAALGEVDWFEIADNQLSDTDGYHPAESTQP